MDSDEVLFNECVTSDEDKEERDTLLLEECVTDDSSESCEDSEDATTEQFCRKCNASKSGNTCSNCNMIKNQAYVHTDNGFLIRLLQRMKWHSKMRRKPARKKARTFTSDFQYQMADMERQLKKQDGRCAISFLPLALRNSSDWQLSTDRIDDNDDYVPLNVRLTALEFNNSCKWGSDTLTELQRLATEPKDEECLAKAITNAQKPAQTRKPQRPSKSRVAADGSTEWECHKCDQFVTTVNMMKNSKTQCLVCDVKLRKERKKSQSAPEALRKRNIAKSRLGDIGKMQWKCYGCDEYKLIEQMKVRGKTECRECVKKRIKSSVYLELRRLFSGAKSASGRRNGKIQRHNTKHKTTNELLKCTITVDDLIRLYVQQNGKCYFSNITFQHPGLKVDGQIINRLRQMSLERLDVKRGYELNNVCLICLAFQGNDHTRITKYSNGGSGGWSKLKVAFLFKWWSERTAGATYPSASWMQFKAANEVVVSVE